MSIISKNKPLKMSAYKSIYNLLGHTWWFYQPLCKARLPWWINPFSCPWFFLYLPLEHSKQPACPGPAFGPAHSPYSQCLHPAWMPQGFWESPRSSFVCNMQANKRTKYFMWESFQGLCILQVSKHMKKHIPTEEAMTNKHRAMTAINNIWKKNFNKLFN